jgi:hypothetical protein
MQAELWRIIDDVHVYSCGGTVAMGLTPSVAAGDLSCRT